MEIVDIKQFNSLSLLEVVYAQLKKDIFKGKYKPGERLIISKISKDLGVSHTPINASLNRLVMEGYVEFTPRKSMRVKSITIDEIVDIYEARKMCELYCADKMVRAAQTDSGFLNELTKIYNVMFENGYESTYEDDFLSFFEGEKQFHKVAVQASDNEKIIKIYSDLNANSLYYYKITFDKFPLGKKRYEETKAEHGAIIDALRNLDIFKLRDSLSAHIQKSIEYIHEHENSKIQS